MQRSVQSARVNPRKYALSEEHGGTGAMTLVEAAKNLNLVTADMLNQPAGVAGLDANSLLSASIFPTGSGTRRGSLSGPATLVQNASSDLKITDFDSTKTYTMSVTGGTVSRNGDTITLIAPAALGNVTLTLNGQQYVFAVVAPHPARPSITSPLNGSTLRSQSTYVSSTAYASVGTVVAQKAAHWQVATDPLFTSIVNESANDAVNLVDWVFALGSVSTTYFVRVRHQNTNNEWSDWSLPITVRSANEFFGAREEAKLTTSEAVTSSALGYSTAMTADGATVFMGNQNHTVSNTSAAGAVYVFKRTGNSWALVQRLISPNVAVSNRFGIVLSVVPDGSRIIVQEYQADASGRVHIYTWNGSAYAWEQTLSSPNITADNHFGVGPAVSSNGLRLFLGERSFVYGGATRAGRFHVYLRTGTSWALEQTIDCPVAARSTNLYFGNSMRANADGSRCIVGSLGQTTGGIPQLGRSYVYLRTGTTWAMEQELVPTDNAPGNNLGLAVGMDDTATYAVVSANGTAGGGAIYVFKRTGTTWAQTAKIQAVDNFNANGFGLTMITADGTKILAMASAANLANILNCGAAYIFTRNGETWTQQGKFTASDAASGDIFGNSGWGSSDLSRFVMGAPGADVAGVRDSGAAYVFS